MTAPFTISQHAAIRYCERVDPRLTPTEAMSAIGDHAAAINAAIGFGAPMVKLGCGARLVIKNDSVITVLAACFWPPMPPRQSGPTA